MNFNIFDIYVDNINYVNGRAFALKAKLEH